MAEVYRFAIRRDIPITQVLKVVRSRFSNVVALHREGVAFDSGYALRYWRLGLIVTEELDGDYDGLVVVYLDRARTICNEGRE